MAHEVFFNPHTEILKGVNVLADAVTETLGPSGKNVIIYKKNGYPLITKDGVTVARNITLSNQLQNVGALLVKEVASKSNEVAGDGTTTATVLARSIYSEGLKYLVAGHNPIDLKRDIDKSVESVINELKSKAKQINNREEIFKVALVSTNNDHLLANLIADAVYSVGVNGVVSVEHSKTGRTDVTYMEGLQLERGLISKYFCNQIERLRAVYERPRFLIVDHAVDNLNALMPALTWCKQSGEPLVILAEEYEDNVLAALIANKLKAGLKLICLHTPGSGDYKPDYMEDLALATGATIFKPDYSPMLSEFKPEHLGTAEKITSTVYETTVTGIKDLTEHVQSLKITIESSTDDFYKSKVKDRHARLTNGIAILNLSSATDMEMKDMKLRVEDAINATKASLEEGVLPGGGIALYRSRPKIVTIADEIVFRALQAPIKAILKNAGLNESEILSQIDKEPQFEHGFDARLRKMGNLYDMGIIDPLKVVRSSLQNAASVAGMLLTSSCCIIGEEKDGTKETKN